MYVCAIKVLQGVYVEEYIGIGNIKCVWRGNWFKLMAIYGR